MSHWTKDRPGFIADTETAGSVVQHPRAKTYSYGHTTAPVPRTTSVPIQTRPPERTKSVTPHIKSKHPHPTLRTTHHETPTAQFGSYDQPNVLPHRRPPVLASQFRALSGKSKPETHVPRSAYRDLLPYCTAETPLSEQQVIELSDIAGNLKEVMLLALRARTDEACARDLIKAVGEDAMRGVVEFFENEFEV